MLCVSRWVIGVQYKPAKEHYSKVRLLLGLWFKRKYKTRTAKEPLDGLPSSPPLQWRWRVLTWIRSSELLWVAAPEPQELSHVEFHRDSLISPPSQAIHKISWKGQCGYSYQQYPDSTQLHSSFSDRIKGKEKLGECVCRQDWDDAGGKRGNTLRR